MIIHLFILSSGVQMYKFSYFTFNENNRAGTAPPPSTPLFARTTFRFQNFLGEDSPRPPYKLAPWVQAPQLKIRSAVPVEHKKIPSRGGEVLIQVQLIHSLPFATSMKKKRYPTHFLTGAALRASCIIAILNENSLVFLPFSRLN